MLDNDGGGCPGRGTAALGALGDGNGDNIGDDVPGNGLLVEVHVDGGCHGQGGPEQGEKGGRAHVGPVDVDARRGCLFCVDFLRESGRAGGVRLLGERWNRTGSAAVVAGGMGFYRRMGGGK